jgi:hypothetical protein
MTPSIVDQIFRDENGNVIIAQPPNLPLIVWGATSLLKLFAKTGQAGTALELIAFGALFTWAWQELFDGVNYFRRALGLTVLLWLILSKTVAASPTV